MEPAASRARALAEPDRTRRGRLGAGPAPSGLVVALSGSAPSCAWQGLPACLLGARDSWALYELVERLAAELYREELRAGGWLLDLGLWGTRLYRAAARDLILRLDGTLLSYLPPPGD